MWGVTMTVDEKRGIAYMPIGGPRLTIGVGIVRATISSPMQLLPWISRPANSNVFPNVHHELWDYDLPPEPLLIDIVKDGKKIPALGADR